MAKAPKVSPVALFLVFGCIARMANSADISLESYVPTQIAEMNRQLSHDPRMLVIVDAATPRYRVRVTYSKNIRPLTPDSSLMLEFWAKALQIPPQVRSLFVNEVQVTEGEATYWLPIQESVLKSLRAEPKDSGTADFFIAKLGSVRSGPVYVVKEYQLR